MAHVLVCRLSAKRRALLANDPGLIEELRREIRKGVSGALDLGRLDPARLRDLAGRFGADWRHVNAILFEAGTQLGHDGREIAPKDLARVSRTAGPPSRREIDKLADQLRALIADTADAKEHLLVIASGIAVSTSVHDQLAVLAETRDAKIVKAYTETLAERAFTSLDEVIIETCLRTPDTGFRHPGAEERRAFFEDLSARLLEPGGAVRLVAVAETRELMLMWASGGVNVASRNCAALMLAHLARGTGSHADAARTQMRALFDQLGDTFVEMFNEVDAPGQAAIAFACVRVGFRKDVVLAPLAPAIRARIVGGELPREIDKAILER